MPGQCTTRPTDIPAREALLALVPAPAYRATRFPTTRSLRLIFWSTLMVGVLMAVVSTLELAFGSGASGVTTSAAGTLVPGFLGHDAFNLVVATPLLLGTLWLARRASLIGLLALPGALFYVMYTYLQYVVGAPFNALFLPYVVLVAASAHSIAALLASIDAEAVKQRLVRRVPARILGGTLVGLGLLTLAQDGGGTLVMVLSGATSEPLARHVWIADLTLEVPAMLMGGTLLWRREALGYVLGAGLLLQFGMTPVGIAMIMAAQPMLIGAPIDLASVVALLVFAAVCFAGLAVFVRGMCDQPPAGVVQNHPQGRRTH